MLATSRSGRILSRYSWQDALTSGDVAALEAFWRAISEQGAPLIEAIEGDVTHHLVTFLWRARAETHIVAVWGGPAGLDHPEDNQMTRLLDTDLWYKTYRVATDLRGVYSFTVDDALSSAGDKATSTSHHVITDPLNPKVSHQDEKEDLVRRILGKSGSFNNLS